MRKIDLIGRRFGRLVVTAPAEPRQQPSGQKATMWCVRCDCGAAKIVNGYSLRNGQSQSCGCLVVEKLKSQNTTHGQRNTRLYAVWRGMILRTCNPNSKTFNAYGGRGISVCAEWRNDFEAFSKWAYLNGYDPNAPRGKCTLDRIDVDGDYCPENCRWVDMHVQNSNKRSYKEGDSNAQV